MQIMSLLYIKKVIEAFIYLLYNLITLFRGNLSKFLKKGNQYKMKKGFFLSAVALLSLGALVGCGSGEDPDSVGTIKVWVDEKVIASTNSVIEQFKAAYPDYNVTFRVEQQSEMGITGEIEKNVDAAADVYIFANDQLARLIRVKAIAAVNSIVRSDVIAANEEKAVAAGTFNNTFYGYPVTDNSLFIYYDKNVIQDSDFNAGLFSVMQKCQTAQKFFYMKTQEANVNNAFFYGAGAKSEWSVDADNNFVEYDDTYKANGLAAVQAMRDLYGYSYFRDGDGTTLLGSTCAVAVGGAWDRKTLEDRLGADRLGIHALGGVKFDATNYLKPFSAYKFAGVKPQKGSNAALRIEVASKFAAYLSGEVGQQARFDALKWLPTNKTVKAKSAVSSDVMVQALAAQANYSHAQGQYPLNWWTAAGNLGKNLSSKTDDQLRTALNTYNSGLNDLLD